MTNTWAILSQLGDSRLLLPTAAVLVAAGAWRRYAWARRWALALFAVGLIVLTSKLAFLGWGIGIARLDFTGFSGHAAISAIVWPVVLWLLFDSGQRGRWGAAVGLMLAIAIAYSRLPLNAHSWSEVISGFVLGAAGTVITISGSGSSQRLHCGWVAGALLAGACVPIAIPQVHTHQMVVRLAKALSGTVKEFDREMLRHRKQHKTH
jgi:membrane-associated phospholipid phosphatase